MRQIIFLLLLIALALISAAILAYPVYGIAQNFADIPFHKVVSRLSSLCGLVFIFLYLGANRLLDRKTVGFELANANVTRDIISGIASGIAIITILELVLLSLNIHIPEPKLVISIQVIAIILAKAVLAGIMVALLEEILYRGALLGVLLDKTHVMNALISSSLIYAAVHFIKFPAVNTEAAIQWYTGLLTLSGAFSRFTDPAILDSFLSLFLFGLLLAVIRLKKGNIIQCIGLHAGVVMAIKTANDLTDYNFDNNYEFLVNQYDHQLGYLAFVWLCILLFAYCRFCVTDRKTG